MGKAGVNGAGDGGTRSGTGIARTAGAAASASTGTAPAACGAGPGATLLGPNASSNRMQAPRTPATSTSRFARGPIRRTDAGPACATAGAASPSRCISKVCAGSLARGSLSSRSVCPARISSRPGWSPAAAHGTCSSAAIASGASVCASSTASTAMPPGPARSCKQRSKDAASFPSSSSAPSSAPSWNSSRCSVSGLASALPTRTAWPGNSSRIRSSAARPARGDPSRTTSRPVPSTKPSIRPASSGTEICGPVPAAWSIPTAQPAGTPPGAAGPRQMAPALPRPQTGGTTHPCAGRSALPTQARRRTVPELRQAPLQLAGPRARKVPGAPRAAAGNAARPAGSAGWAGVARMRPRRTPAPAAAVAQRTGT